MQFQILNLAALFATAMAVPYAASSGAAPYTPCSGLESTPLCCAVDALGVVSLDCEAPDSVPTSADNFVDVCGAREPQCCLLNVADLAVACSFPAGTD
ncbi:hypothetical protein SBRCBS47491_003860 [Sporothrix bragantina]|uniref:Hydrophobin n=1 Tax=Sporothrix bragantina TaxID=671064 RepID=A0ABP0BIP0_9PEZI